MQNSFHGHPDTSVWRLSAAERQTLRNLARKVADIAADPTMEERRGLWIEHNSLRKARPMMLIFPEGSWVELLPERSLTCEGDRARAIETNLRQRIYTYEHFQDDTVVEAGWVELAVLGHSGWGLEPRRRHSDAERGAWGFEPVLKDRSDLKHLRHPDVIYDEGQSQHNVERMQDLFGDILEVKAAGIKRISYHLMNQYTDLRGLQEMYFDLIDNPGLIHEVMAFLEEGHHRMRQQLIELNLLSLNNDNTYHSSGGNSYTDALPAQGYNGNHVRPCDMWASAESQEMAPVSPAMQDEFAMQYEKRLLAPFALSGYGCCEPLHHKLDQVLTIPNIRRISISPFADVDVAADKLKGQAIFSWKPAPWHLIGDFEPDTVRDYVRHTLDVAQANDCFLEMILKDTHTCEHHPERFDRWTEIARELIGEYAD
ncbi:MAG: hypothetical protein GY762_20555 [Proteobacteria bacterium]|nr:hypothetical protein [Pseudomonadota bacterium]